MKEIDVIGIGVSTIDQFYIVEHFPCKEEVQRAKRSKSEGGGPIATALVTLARLGAKTIMLDCIGNDWVGNQIVSDLRKEKVLTDYMIIKNGFTSSLTSIIVTENDGARTIIYSPGNSGDLSETDINEDLISRAKYIHINGRHLSACLKACKIAEECNTKISFDGGSHRYRDELRKIVPNTDICIVAKDFSEKYTGKTDINEAANQLLLEGPEIVVITDGKKGSWLYTKNIYGYHQPAFETKKVVDTTGCGDSFHGAFLFGLIDNYNLYDSIRTASMVAALNTLDLGGRSALPTLNELQNFAAKYNISNVQEEV
jgi:sugar/nucleoside kinase (ribokinase family)